MSHYIHRPRQAIGLIYILMYIVFFFTYAFILNDDQSWAMTPKFTATVFIWFTLSLAVKVSMFLDRAVELLNLAAIGAFLAIGFTYNPQPDHYNSIENFCYYLHFMGGSVCDVCDFFYESCAKRPKDGV